MSLHRNPKEVRRISPRRRLRARWLLTLCVLLLLADLLGLRHEAFAFAEFPGFYPAIAFAAGVVLVVGARLVRRYLMRPEDYYERGD